jgi:Glycosyl hydrolases family 39/Bacterial Ig-like domain (group 2)
LRSLLRSLLAFFVFATATLANAAVSVSVAPATSAVGVGGAQQFSASVNGTTTTTVNWSVDGIAGGNATAGTVTSSGLYSAPAAVGTHVVTATSTVDATKSASAAVTVFASISVDFGSRTYTSQPIPSNLFGASVAYLPNWSAAGLLTQSGVTGVRLYANIQAVYATQTPDWTKIDPLITSIQKAGMRPILQLVFTPTWLQPSTCPGVTDLSRSAPTDVNAWANIAASYVTHMNATFPGLIQDYEIWNEPDQQGFLCVSDNTDATRRNTYFSIYAAAGPAMRTAAGSNTIHIGGPVISAPDQRATTWIQPFVGNASLAPYIDFVSYHNYFGYNNNLTWDSGTDNAYSRTQGKARGVISIYNNVARIVKAGLQPNAASTPIYITEYNVDSDNKVDCCRNSPQYAPVWNAMFVADLLNTVYQGAGRLPGRLNYYAISNQYIGTCLIGTIDPAMDCVYPTSGSPAAYPQLVAYNLMATSNYLGLGSGGYNAQSVSPPATQAGIVVAGFYNANNDSVLLVNPTANMFSQIPVNLLNPGYAYASGTSYLLNSSNQNISSQTLSLAASGSGFTTNVDLPPYSVVGITLSQTGPPVVSVTVAPKTVTITTGTTQQFSSTVTNATDMSVTWSVDSVNGGNSALGTVDNTGLYTAPATSGLHTVTATSNADPTKSDSATVTVNGSGSTVSVTISPASVNLFTNNSQQFTATVTGASDTSLTWSVNGIAGGNSTVGTITSAGLYLAPGSAGTYTVTATSNADTTQSASAGLAVTTSGVSVTVSPTRTSVTITQPQQFIAIVSNSSNTNVTWSVDSIAGGNSTVGTVDINGIYMPPSTGGFHVITVTSAADTSKSASASLVVTNNPGVFTYYMDNNRSGANTNETVLTPGNVASSFGQLFARNVDGNVYAQPLYVANLLIPNVGYRNVVFVATEHDSVYAFDADGLSTTPLWQTSFINASAGITTIPSSALPSGDEVGTEVGITGTPVIDPTTNTMYVLAATLENGTYHNRLHALDITTGADMAGSPVDIAATYPGTGDGSTKKHKLNFNVTEEFNRSALLLSNGVVYIAWASYLDQPPFHGWLMAYAANNLTQLGVWVSTPNGSDGGIWESGCGPAADQNGYIYFATGNGTFSVSTGGTDYGDTVVKLQLTSAGLSVVDYFTPNNQSYLSSVDKDLGSSCTLLVPADQSGSHTHELITGGKQDQIYVLDRDNLGQYNGSNSTAVEVLNDPFGTTGVLKSSAAYWNGNLYWVAEQQAVQSFSLLNGLMSPKPTSQGAYIVGFPGASPVVSANGTANAIVWLWQRGNGILHAYDANNLSNRLYVSASSGVQVRFVNPVVVNGKVYVGTNNQLVVFGLTR